MLSLSTQILSSCNSLLKEEYFEILIKLAENLFHFFLENGSKQIQKPTQNKKN